MKIEKINDRQIRCVLTKEELEMRKIRLSELVCGSEKARGLFRDMILRASRELGFSFNNNPLMIEALPTGKDQLVLIITRVDDPKELDTRFRSLSGASDTDRGASDETSVLPFSGADDILNLLKHITKKLGEKGGASLADAELPSGRENAGIEKAGKKTPAADGKNAPAADGKNAPAADGKNAPAPDGKKAGKDPEEELSQYTRFCLFRNIEHVLRAAKLVPEDYRGENSLYKNPEDGAFYLLVRKSDTEPEQFNRICNVLSEYSMPMDYSSGMDEFFREHMQVIVADHALQHLRSV